MNNLRLLNEDIYEQYKNLNNIEELSSPLLVSSKRFLENIKEHPIMYIGQETNGWVNEDDIALHPIDDIENNYDSFLIDYKTSKSIYWQFIKDILSTDYDNLHKDIVWINTLICGNRFDIGHPILDNKFKNLSLKYLLEIYDYFKPSYIINVSGNDYPYFELTNSFLKEIGINMDYPKYYNPVVCQENYIWSYHPKYLRMSKNEDVVKEKIKELIK